MPINYIEGQCDICGADIDDYNPFAIYKDGRIVCQVCAEANHVFKWVTPTEPEAPEEDATEDPIPEEIEDVEDEA